MTSQLLQVVPGFQQGPLVHLRSCQQLADPLDGQQPLDLVPVGPGADSVVQQVLMFEVGLRQRIPGLHLGGRGQMVENRADFGRPAGGLQQVLGGRVVVQQAGRVQLFEAIFVALGQGRFHRLPAGDPLLGLGHVGLQLRGNPLAGPHPLDQLRHPVPLLCRDQRLERLAPQQYFVHGRDVVQPVPRQLEQIVRQVADLFVRRVQQVMVQRRGRGIVEVLRPEQDLVVFRLVDVRDPQVGSRGQCPQGHVDHQGREIVQAGKQDRVGVAAGVLVRDHARFQIAASGQRRHAHAVVVDQAEMAFGRDHHVAMLQVPMHHLLLGQLADQVQPDVGGDLQGLGVSLPAAIAGPLEQRDAGHPLHDQQRVQLAVAGRADAALVIVEADDAGNIPAFQVLADRPVMLQTLVLPPIEYPDGELAAVRAVAAVDRGEIAAAGLGLADLVHLDRALPQRRVAKGHLRVLQDASEIRNQRPRRHGKLAPGIRCPPVGARPAPAPENVNDTIPADESQAADGGQRGPIRARHRAVRGGGSIPARFE